MAALVATALIAPALGQDAKPVELKWKFEKDKAFFQTMKTLTSQNMKVMGSDIKQDQSQTFVFSWTPVEEKPDGIWIIRQKIIKVEMNIDIGGNKINYDSSKETGASNPLGDFFKALVDPKSEFTLTLKLDPKDGYKVLKVEGREDFLKRLTSANPQMEPLLKQILSEEALREMSEPSFAPLPGRAVKPKDTWVKESVLKMGPIGTYKNKYTYTYEGPDDKDKSLDRIKMDTDLQYSAPTEQEAASGLPFRIKSADLKASNAKGTVMVNPAKGRVERSESSLDLEGKLIIEIGGQSTEVILKQTQKTTVETTDNDPTAKKS
jgi:hypothetical protein